MSKRDPAMLKAIKQVGGPAALGRAIGTTRQAISQWTRVPHNHVLTIERMSGVPRHELRPDIYPPEDASVEPDAA